MATAIGGAQQRRPTWPRLGITPRPQTDHVPGEQDQHQANAHEDEVPPLTPVKPLALRPADPAGRDALMSSHRSRLPRSPPGKRGCSGLAHRKIFVSTSRRIDPPRWDASLVTRDEAGRSSHPVPGSACSRRDICGLVACEPQTKGRSASIESVGVFRAMPVPIAPSFQVGPSRNSFAITSPVSRTPSVRVKRASSVSVSSMSRQ